jgi:S-adenosylmethionine:tRNA ribosyltransferase-isomerase
MRVSDFDYELPAELIATQPARPRDTSRMLVLDRQSGHWHDSMFRNIPEFLRESDVLVINDTRVIRARIYATLLRQTGGRPIELLFARPVKKDTWQVLCKPGRQVRTGDRVIFAGGAEGTFGETGEYGLRPLQIRCETAVEDLLERWGHVPLPPYIKRPDTASDAEEYQTVFASVPGAVAAPTAGLHFTPAVLDGLARRGVRVLRITLHVGIGTFLPVREEDPRKHSLTPERFSISSAAARELNTAREEGRRIIAVGTTTARTLEYVIRTYDRFEGVSGETNLYILPGYRFQALNGLFTNFHLPRSTLLMLVAAFTSRDLILRAYRHAIEERYRFYSYGDSMLII